MKSTYFISDLHLAENTPGRFELLERFCTSIAPNAQALYMLGDLFAYWAGPGVSDPLLTKLHQALLPLRKAKVPIYFMPGNRDFLLTGHVLLNLGIAYLSDPHILYIGSRKILLTHGDRYLRDPGYQRYRQFVQHPKTMRLMLGLPTWLRSWIVKRVRAWSERHQQERSGSYLSPRFDDCALMSALEPDGYTVIHGHTHIPQTIHFGTNNTYVRHVLSEWFDDRGYALAVNAQGITVSQIV